MKEHTGTFQSLKCAAEIEDVGRGMCVGRGEASGLGICLCLGPLSVTYVLLGLARLFFFFLYVRACMILKIKAGRLCSLML